MSRADLIQPENVNDETLEYAARLIEEPDISELFGHFGRSWPKGTRRKRKTEDQELALRVAERVRRSAAAFVRAMKNRPDLSARQTLRDIAGDLSRDFRHEVHLADAWPLAWRGWLDIKCIIRCNSNVIPPETEYRIEITDEGRKVITEEEGGGSRSVLGLAGEE